MTDPTDQERQAGAPELRRLLSEARDELLNLRLFFTEAMLGKGEAEQELAQVVSRLRRWEEWHPVNSALAELKDQAALGSSLAAQQAYINGLGFHLQHTEAERDAARAALEAVEGVPSEIDGDILCAWCSAMLHYEPHAPDCQRQTALGGDK